MKKYLAVYKGGSGEIIEKKSRFIAHVENVESVGEAQEFIELMKKEYWDARHNCYAFSVGTDQPVTRCSDDGEPSGTGGKPILEVIQGSGIQNIVIVVTRYFGGTLLGTGGLVRSYTQAAQAALADAEVVRMCLCRVIGVEIEYSLLDKVLYYLKQQKVTPYDQVYTDKVSFMLTIARDRADQICEGLISLSGGKAEILEVEEGFFPLRVSEEE